VQSFLAFFIFSMLLALALWNRMCVFRLSSGNLNYLSIVAKPDVMPGAGLAPARRTQLVRDRLSSLVPTPAMRGLSVRNPYKTGMVAVVINF
jgi:hypothetical protein